MAARDYSDFLSTPAYGKAERSTRDVDHATKHLQTMFQVNTVVRVALPAVFAIATAAQLSAGISDKVNTSFGQLDTIRTALGVSQEDMLHHQPAEEEPDLNSLFSHLKN